ncbi:MAG: hypothetical protein WKF36_06110, partial [Candidatus Nitrosocosmicus sp.]
MRHSGNGGSKHHGQFHNVAAAPAPAHRRFRCLFRHWGKKAFQLAEQVDGAFMVMRCPIIASHRNSSISHLGTCSWGFAYPPLVAHVLVALTGDQYSVPPAGTKCLTSLP